MANNNIVLIMGKPNTGKSTSLMFLKNQDKTVYFNTDKKDLPFPHNFMKDIYLDQPEKIINFLHQIEKQPDVEGVVLDTITFLMSTYERTVVRTAANGQKAWGDYGAFYGDFIDAIKSSKKDFAVLAHEDSVYDENNQCFKSKIPVKGAVGKTGVKCFSIAA